MTDHKTHKLQDNHLLDVMNNIILTQADVVNTTASNNTIRVVGDGLQDVLNTIVEQVPVLDMKVYKVNPVSVKDIDKDVHIMYFTSNFIDTHRRLGTL